MEMSDRAEIRTQFGKKPFDKKEWRRRKYSNKYKVEQWEQRRRKGVLHSYYKELRKIPGYSRPEKNSTEETAAENKRPPKLNAYRAAQLEFECKQAEKAAKIEELERKKEENAAAIAKYRARKTEVYKKLSKKTRKGQPVMKGRMELLLEKLEKSLQS